MDLEEWEVLPNNGLLEIHDHENKMVFFRKYASEFVDDSTIEQSIVQKPQEDEEVIKEVVTKVPNIVLEDEKDQVMSQVFFKKMKESEFENMKLDSPKFNNNKTFEDKVEVNKIKKREMEGDVEEKSIGGLNLWNWRLIGIGAICSFGVAAVFIFIGNQQKQIKVKQNQKLKFQFSDDKKIKQVVHQQIKLNEAISEERGAPNIIGRKLTVEDLLLSSLEHIQDCLSVS